MNRAFISLYLILVLAILLLGLVLNKFWEQVNPVQEVDPAVADFMLMLEAQLTAQPASSLPTNLHYQVKILDLQDFASSSVALIIKSGELVNASDETAARYYKLTSNNKVIALTNRANSIARSPLYFIFIAIFYGAIALVIFLWVWPLSRDLSRLIKHTQQVGAQGTLVSISLSPRSLLSPFANAFNTMATRLSEIMRSQKEMTYAVSHELRTPLARMKFALAMAGAKLDSEAHRQLESVKRDIAEMEGLINSLLTYASFEQRAEPLDQREGHMEALLVNMLKRASNPEAISIRIHNEAAEEVFVCEWALMQTAVQNLLHNALGFARQNILITMGASERFFWVVVEDDGTGVPETQRDHIFDSFVRLHGESDLNRHSGFGLGLAIVKRIITWHQGSVTCSQSPLGGAKFSLQWPKK